jgi:hypothetical protein
MYIEIHNNDRIVHAFLKSLLFLQIRIHIPNILAILSEHPDMIAVREKSPSTLSVDKRNRTVRHFIENLYTSYVIWYLFSDPVQYDYIH